MFCTNLPSLLELFLSSCFPCFLLLTKYIITKKSIWNVVTSMLKQQKTFSVFPYGYRNTRGSLGEREIEVEDSMGTRGRMFSILLQNNSYRKLKSGNSLLYQSVNSQYCSWWRMQRWRIMAWTFPCFPYSYRNTAFSHQSSRFQNVIL